MLLCDYFQTVTEDRSIVDASVRDRDAVVIRFCFQLAGYRATSTTRYGKKTIATRYFIYLMLIFEGTMYWQSYKQLINAQCEYDIVQNQALYGSIFSVNLTNTNDKLICKFYFYTVTEF